MNKRALKALLTFGIAVGPVLYSMPALADDATDIAMEVPRWRNEWFTSNH